MMSREKCRHRQYETPRAPAEISRLAQSRLQAGITEANERG